MNIIKKTIAAIVPAYRAYQLRKYNEKLFAAIIGSLPAQLEEIKNQTLSSRFGGLSEWKLFPAFKFVTICYGADTYLQFKKSGCNFKISGLSIFSNRHNRFETIEIMVHNNLVTGLKISNSDYQVGELDLAKITVTNILIESVVFPKIDVEKFYESLNADYKAQIDADQIEEIDFNNRTYYGFYDLEDGNYLAVDKHLKVYSLVHDAKPMATQMKISFDQILADIKNNKFDKEKHLDERYRTSR